VGTGTCAAKGVRQLSRRPKERRDVAAGWNELKQG